MKKTAITDDLIVFSDGFVWKRLSRKTAEALWNSVISHELELYWVRTDDESEAAIERFNDIESAFKCGDYVCIEVGKLPYNMTFGYIRNLQEISSQAISRLTDTKDCSRDVAFAMIRVWTKEFTEKYEDYKFDGDYYDLVDEFIDRKLKGLGASAIDKNTYIEIAFIYRKELYVERIYTKDIDKNHYENMWDWWFGNKESDTYPDLVFELTADKNSDGKLTTENMYINVYENEDSDEPIDIIKEISYRKSWCEYRAFG